MNFRILVKSKRFRLLAISLLLSWRVLADPATSAITYQGRLLDGGFPANGNYDLTFALYDAANNGEQVGSAITNTAVAVSNGLFTLALDFSVAAFNGDARWLEIATRTGTNDFGVLSPRQPITPAPYAITALNPVQLTAATNDLNLALCAKISAAINASWMASTNWVAAQGYQLTNSPTRKSLTIPATVSGTNYILDFTNEVVQLTATTSINLLQSTNRTSAGWYGECLWYIQGGPTNQMLSVNPSWVSLGTLAANLPYLLASNKLTVLAFSVRGDSETNVAYAIVRQQ